MRIAAEYVAFSLAAAARQAGARLAHRLAHEPSGRDAGACSTASNLPPQQKTPRRGGEAFLGLLQGGEICISIYVDPWEVGGPFDVSRADIVGSDEPYGRR